MDILQVPSSPDIEVRCKALLIVLEMVPSRNIQEVILFLTKDPTKTQNESFEKVILFKSRENRSLILFSTETGIIFGITVYGGHGFTENCVVLNDIYIDIMDYINPAYCNETQLRSMQTEFEWENKININTNIDDLRAYLQHIMASTNMSCLTPKKQLEGDCGFLSANMYAKSIFGDDALANSSIEKNSNVSVTAHIRIRSKTQGIALSLGDKTTLAQRTAV